MTVQAAAGAGRRPVTLKLAWLGLAALGLAVLLVEGERLWLAAVQPLWLDETWTGVFAATPDWRTFGREVSLEVNPPLYYLFMRGWGHLFGLSDWAIKAPGALGVLAAAAAPLALRPRGLNTLGRGTWAALLFFWWGCGLFLDGRCYGLLLAVCVLQSLAFAWLLREPSTPRALTWCALSAAAILLHYYALFIGLAQGLIYLGRRGRRAARTWPALVGLAPAAAWIAWHIPRLSRYGGQDVAWHPPLTPSAALADAAFTLGAYSPLLAGVALALAGIGVAAHRLERKDAPGQALLTDEARALAWTAASGLLATALVIGSGLLRPTLTARYLIPEVPAMLLGIALAASSLKPARAVCAALVAVYFAFALDPAALAAKLADPSAYGEETASQFLLDHGVTDVVLVCDHPLAKIMEKTSLWRMGMFFFQREHAAVSLVPLVVTPQDDANALALAAARGPTPGILWMYDRTKPTAARAHAPDIYRADRRWSCLRLGDDRIGVLACYLSPAARAALRPSV